MRLIPYLNFDGNAAEAIAFYAEVFGTEVKNQTTFGDMPPQDWVHDGNRHRVAHARIETENVALMVSDSAGFEPFEGHKGHSINVSLGDVEAGRALFETLSAGGEVRMPYAPSFWAKGFGVCRDKFGVEWMVNVEQTAG